MTVFNSPITRGTSTPLQGLTWCLLSFRASKQGYVCQCSSFITGTQVLMHVTVHGAAHCKTVCTKSWPWEKSPLPHQGVEPASAACRPQHPTDWTTSPPQIISKTVQGRNTALLPPDSLPLATHPDNTYKTYLWSVPGHPLERNQQVKELHPEARGFHHLQNQNASPVSHSLSMMNAIIFAPTTDQGVRSCTICWPHSSPPLPHPPTHTCTLGNLHV